MKAEAVSGRGPVLIAGPRYANGNSRAGGPGALAPLVRMLPQYPPRAALENVEGTVRTCFTVLPNGSAPGSLRLPAVAG